MDMGHFLTFASDAEIAGLWGLGCIIVALLATLAEVRRNRRARIDGIVGWMPWRAIFLLAAIAGGGLILLAVKGLLAA
ncbi:hypothetical protein [Pelagerythrobacter rhizovicinus]|uniref:Uncharacterized protein n=1 Tax=Pelagerythrobacter rhizovicinus TaxID=2268576 RepID=A0A4V1QWJ3_9SPHN|nr:hypothetical protein [Pelagerythrobacter rhizovicinus]RXZ66356.1 hypothetical protein ETX26_06585 [Pelagerythrobacter rhizovicinus]